MGHSRLLLRRQLQLGAEDPDHELRVGTQSHVTPAHTRHPGRCKSTQFREPARNSELAYQLVRNTQAGTLPRGSKERREQRAEERGEESREQRAEGRGQRAEKRDGREQRAESREQRAESREQRRAEGNESTCRLSILPVDSGSRIALPLLLCEQTHLHSGDRWISTMVLQC